jgi:hypothetical protein
MKDEKFMNQVVARDFSVELISNSGNASLFGALREGGTERVKTAQGIWETHTAGVWHFVSCARNGNLEHIQQWHIPRYKMAASIERLNEVCLQHPKARRPIQDSLSQGFSTTLLERGKLGFQTSNGVLFGDIKPSFLGKIREDLPILAEARDKVKQKDNEFYLPRAKTAAGYPVQSASRQLIEAIAFERLSLKRLNAGNFGVYSAYCTYRDFETSVRMPDDLIAELVDGQFEHDAETHNSQETADIFMDVQSRLLSKPIWGKAVSMKKSQACKILSKAMDELSRTQRVQFILMNGMHGSGTFLPLAVISGVIGFERYAEYMAQHFQPDSPEEQDLRKETAYIQLYGELA